MKKHHKKSHVVFSERRLIEHRRGSHPEYLEIEYNRDGTVTWKETRPKDDQ